ncbi:hypothetical protein SISNIDRAFT_451276 [Sistotremastrum niveocremeum HHB9708]|uniref:Uncharacterized protein n=1 Tax=Sistotremastrum niveocremeum HHB9708 TaxID=1314777 RepID=A0A164Y279_9AGAM|nr:hypothetical protein SISNIDRAFT_451276 [Sistotremastrum niveocremeum HHB9708]
MDVRAIYIALTALCSRMSILVSIYDVVCQIKRRIGYVVQTSSVETRECHHQTSPVVDTFWTLKKLIEIQ